VIFTIAFLAIAGGAAYGGYYYGGKNSGVNGTNNTASSVFGAKESPELPETVAIVNGDEIKKEEFLKRVQLAAMSYSSQGVDISSTDAQNQIMQSIINTMTSEKVVLQQATAKGIKVTSEEIDAEYKKIVEYLGGQEKADEAMANQGLDSDYVHKDIERQLTIQAYLNSTIDLSGISVSDEEVQTAYDNITAEEGAEKPAFETVSEDIKSQLLTQKQQQAINEHVDSLVKNSSVQVMF